MAQRRRLPPIHPGELLRDELGEIGVSLNELGRALRVPMNRISAIGNGKSAITVDSAQRLRPERVEPGGGEGHRATGPEMESSGPCSRQAGFSNPTLRSPLSGNGVF